MAQNIKLTFKSNTKSRRAVWGKYACAQFVCVLMSASHASHVHASHASPGKNWGSIQTELKIYLPLVVVTRGANLSRFLPE